VRIHAGAVAQEHPPDDAVVEHGLPLAHRVTTQGVGAEPVLPNERRFVRGGRQRLLGAEDLVIPLRPVAAVDRFTPHQLAEQSYRLAAQGRQRPLRVLLVLGVAEAAEQAQPAHQLGVPPWSHVEGAGIVQQGRQGLSHTTRLVERPVAGSDTARVSKGRATPDLVALQQRDACAAPREEVGAGDADHASSDHDDVRIGPYTHPAMLYSYRPRTGAFSS
jgi:hypothetical protein